MASSNEMYERGVEDALQDDFNSFYYQHYFYYRQGYDRTRRQMRRPTPTGAAVLRHPLFLIVLVGSLIIMIGGGYILFNTYRATSRVTHHVASTITLPVTMIPTIVPQTPTPSSVPLPKTPTLHIGGTAQVVNVGQSPLRARRNPGLDQPVQARFTMNVQVMILEGPVEADGLLWWRIEGSEGSGWSAERGPDGVVLLLPQ